MTKYGLVSLDSMLQVTKWSWNGKLDSLYHSALRFITSLGYSIHHCDLYRLAILTSLSSRRLKHWYIIVYKVILGKTPNYLNELLITSSILIILDLRLFWVFQFLKFIGNLETILAPWSWNKLQEKLNLDTFKGVQTKNWHPCSWDMFLFWSVCLSCSL